MSCRSQRSRDARGVVACVDDNSTIFNPLCLNELRFADGANNNVSLLNQVWQVFRARVTNSDRRVGIE